MSVIQRGKDLEEPCLQAPRRKYGLSTLLVAPASPGPASLSFMYKEVRTNRSRA